MTSLKKYQLDSAPRLDLLYYLRALRLHRRRLLLVNIAVLISAIVVSALITPTYRAKATMLVQPTRINLSGATTRIISPVAFDELFETVFQMLRSQRLVFQVVDRLSLWEHPELNQIVGNTTGPEAAVPESKSASIRMSEITDLSKLRTVDNVLRRLRIKAVPKTKLITITFDSTDRRLASRITNGIADQFIQNNFSTRQASYDRKQRNYSAALAQTNTELKRVHAEIESIARSNQLPANAELLKILDDTQLVASNNQLIMGRFSIQQATARVRLIESAADDPVAIASLPEFSSDTVLLSHLEEYKSTQRNLDELRIRYSEKHPLVQDQLTSEATIEAAIDAHISQLLDGLRSQLRNANRQVSVIEGDVASQRDALRISNTVYSEIEVLRREEKALLEKYSRLNYSLKETHFSSAGLDSDVEIVDRATPPKSPHRPQNILFIGLAMVTSMIFSFLGAGVAVHLGSRATPQSEKEPLRVTLLQVVSNARSVIVKPRDFRHILARWNYSRLKRKKRRFLKNTKYFLRSCVWSFSALAAMVRRTIRHARRRFMSFLTRKSMRALYRLANG